MSNEGKNSKPADEQLASILWGLSNQANSIAAMTYVSYEAEFIAKERVAEQHPKAK